MKMTSLKEPIIRQVVFLIFVFFFVMLSIALFQRYLSKRVISLHLLTSNETVKVELSYLTHSKLQIIQDLFQKISQGRTENELELFTKEINYEIEELKKILSVIEHGGSVTQTFQVHFANEEKLDRSFVYKNYNINRINLEVIEIRAKLVELQGYVASFWQIMARGMQDAERQEPGNLLGVYKRIVPFFDRLLENSHRIYFEAQGELEELKQLEDKLQKTARQWMMLLRGVAGVVVLGLGWVILRNSNGIIREKNLVQEALRASNENLEQAVIAQTVELVKEVEDRQWAEAEQRQQAEFLKTVIDSLDHPFYVVDIETYVVQMLNKAACELAPLEKNAFCYGLMYHRKEPCGGVHYPCPITEMKRTNKPVVLEHIHRDRDGNNVYIEVHGYPIFNANGELYRMIEYCLDITEKKRAEIKLAETNRNLEATVRKRTLRLEEEVAQRKAIQLQLKESESYYRTLIEASHDLSMIVDQTGTITYSSPSSQLILGYSPEQMVGKSLFEYLHKNDLQWGAKRFGEFILSLKPKHRLRYRVRTCEGSYKVLEASVRNLLGDPVIHGLLLSARDITKKQLAEEKLRKLQLVVEQNPSTIVITDLEGKIEYVNKQFEKVTGYTRQEALGKNPNILNSGRTPPETFVDLWETLGRGEVWNGEFVNRSKSGEIYHENVLLSPLKNEKGEVTHYVAIKENITELKHAREAAEASNRAKSDFLSRMSHELRTPLNAINGFSQLLLSKNKKHTLDERQTNQVLQIYTAGQHLLELINEILDLSRVESGHLMVSFEPVVVADAVMDCISLSAALAEKTGVSVQVDEGVKDLPLIQADRTRFKQVILNLLSNAVKYNRPPGTVSFTGKVDGNMVSLEVADSGLGISKKHLEELFVPFTRFGQEKSGIEGTGIGMTITKQLVELMKGRLEVESEVGVGSVFRVKLPLAEDTAGQVSQVHDVPGEKDTLPEGTQTGTILYIEDDLSNIQLMRNIMEQWPGVSLVVRKNAEKGIKAIAMLQPDLVFMDLHLPGMSGQKAFTELQGNPKTKDIKVIALSADVLPATIQECLDLGFAAYLTKPITMDRLSSVLDEYLPG